jgi:hypothetical protein
VNDKLNNFEVSPEKLIGKSMDRSCLCEFAICDNAFNFRESTIFIVADKLVDTEKRIVDKRSDEIFNLCELKKEMVTGGPKDGPKRCVRAISDDELKEGECENGFDKVNGSDAEKESLLVKTPLGVNGSVACGTTTAGGGVGAEHVKIPSIFVNPAIGMLSVKKNPVDDLMIRVSKRSNGHQQLTIVIPATAVLNPIVVNVVTAKKQSLRVSELSEQTITARTLSKCR